MHDPWIEKLSDHMDGLLNEADARALDAHLAACPECRSIAAGLRDVVAAARNAPVLAPPRDLWSDIAARIADSPARPAADTTAVAWPAASGAAAAATPAHDARVRPLRDGRARAARATRRYSFSTPQLAAAAVLLMALSGAGVWMIAARSAVPAVAAGTIIQSAGDPARSTSTVAAAVMPPDYTQDVAVLERALEENRADLDPGTVEIIRRSLESIDRAISDARSALAADPGNPYLHRQLDNTMQKKIDVLRRATGARRAQS